MNKILEETFAQEKPDPAFEQRMLAGFRNRIPQRSGLVKVLVDLMRLRATQIAAVAAALLGLVQIGRMITGEPATAPRAPERYAQVEVGPPQAPESRPSQAGALDRSGGISVGRPQDLALQPPAPPVAARSKFQKEGKVSATTAEPAKAAQSEAGDVEASELRNNAAVREEATQSPVESSGALANRKLIRNATVELEIVSFDSAVQKITAFANEEHGYVATTDSEKQANGKLKGQIVVKVLPENLDRFL